MRRIIEAFLLILLYGTVAVTEANRIGNTQMATHSQFLRSSYHVDNRSNYPQFTSCSRNASVCRDPARFSRPTTCCWSRFCVDTSTDPAHCGGCSKACGYGYSCCSGHCVDLLRNRKNCGRCNNECSHHVKCEFGMCGYAYNAPHNKQPRY